VRVSYKRNLFNTGLDNLIEVAPGGARALDALGALWAWFELVRVDALVRVVEGGFVEVIDGAGVVT
jgi:hypothetical protein